MKPACINCAHAVKASSGIGEGFAYYCHRLPPSAQYVDRSERLAIWPLISGFDYCGEFVELKWMDRK
jgi:hypothetical protein